MSKLVLVLLLCVGAALPPARSAEPQQLPELRAAQRLGWDTAAVLAQGLASSDPKRFPGIHAWLKDYRAAGGTPGKRGADGIPRLDVERLVTRNPNFWRAYFELAPGDGGTMLLHASMLLAAGEASRAAYMVVIARQTPEIANELLQAMDNLLLGSRNLIASGAQHVAVAVKLHESGQPALAAKQLREAINAWPGNALAHYELALALLAQQYVDAGRAPPARARLGIHSELAPGAAAVAAYANARRHDPLLIRAYQETDKAGANALLILGKTVRPRWETLARDTHAQARDDTLGDLAEAFQDIGVHDLALALGQVVFGRQGGYDDDDRKFIAANLRVLVPNATDAVIKGISAQRPEFARLVLP